MVVKVSKSVPRGKRWKKGFALAKGLPYANEDLTHNNAVLTWRTEGKAVERELALGKGLQMSQRNGRHLESLFQS